jgi:hypothetical protein
MDLVALLRQRDLLPAAFFCFSKKRCDQAADMVQVGGAGGQGRAGGLGHGGRAGCAACQRARLATVGWLRFGRLLQLPARRTRPRAFTHLHPTPHPPPPTSEPGPDQRR